MKRRVSAVLRLTLAMLMLLSAAPRSLWACACGCGVFQVGTSSMFPTQTGLMPYIEYDYMDQDQNWSGSGPATAANNGDKEIRTSFVTAGVQDMVSRDWGFSVELPYWDRYFRTTLDNGAIGAFTHSAVGDMRIRGLYTGFSPDLSSGLTFGLRLPTGDYTYPNFDADTEIGTGSTDLLLGGYHRGRIGSAMAWFLDGELDAPIVNEAGYRPGDETDLVAGAYYDRWYAGSAKVSPMLQLVGSWRTPDSGIQANAGSSGYQRMLLTPGLEVDAAGYSFYADVAIPVYQYMRGNQLVAPELIKFNISRRF